MTLEAELRAALDAKAKPVGSLGRLEDLAVQIGLVQGTRHPVVRNPLVLVFAGDHGAVAAGVSAFPQAVTAAMVGLYLEGGAAINVLAGLSGARVLVVDAGVAAELEPRIGLLPAKVAFGTQDWTRGAAMTAAEVQRCLDSAAAIMGDVAADGTTVVALGEMGIGNTSSAALLVHKVVGLPLQVGRGAGLDEAGRGRKQALVEAACARVAVRLGPAEALAAFGGFEIAMLTGAILASARLGIVCVVDGLIVTAAAVLAHAMEPGCLAACVFAHRSAEPGHDAMLAHLGARPLLDLGMRLGEGSGAALAIPLLQAATRLLEQMADLADLA